MGQEYRSCRNAVYCVYNSYFYRVYRISEECKMQECIEYIKNDKHRTLTYQIKVKMDKSGTLCVLLRSYAGKKRRHTGTYINS